jgi:hypothetical protein
MSDNMTVDDHIFPAQQQIFRRDRRMTFGDHIDNEPEDWRAYIRKDIVQDLIDTIRRGQNEERFASLLLQKTAWK